MTPQWSNVQYIYVSKRKITDKERTQITDTGIKYRRDMIFMKYSAEIYEYIRGCLLYTSDAADEARSSFCKQS